jgi:hypothetical protein
MRSEMRSLLSGLGISSSPNDWNKFGCSLEGAPRCGDLVVKIWLRKLIDDNSM